VFWNSSGRDAERHQQKAKIKEKEGGLAQIGQKQNKVYLK
jgi:hypothetical protein